MLAICKDWQDVLVECAECAECGLEARRGRSSLKHNNSGQSLKAKLLPERVALRGEPSSAPE